jgi:hypothetical protein
MSVQIRWDFQGTERTSWSVFEPQRLVVSAFDTRLKDPYHTYLSLAAVALCPPPNTGVGWKLQPLDPLLNANEETSSWARKHIPITSVQWYK